MFSLSERTHKATLRLSTIVSLSFDSERDFGCRSGSDRQLPQKFPDRFPAQRPSSITSLPIGSLSPATRHRYASPVSIQAEASRRKGRQTGRQAEGIHHNNINPNGIYLRKLGDHAHHEPVCCRQHR